MVTWAQGRLETFLKFRYNVAAGIHYSRSYLHTCGVCGCVRPYQRASMLNPHHHLPAVRPSRSCNQSHIKTNKASLSRGYASLPLYYSTCMNVKPRRDVFYIHVIGSWTPARPCSRVAFDSAPAAPVTVAAAATPLVWQPHGPGTFPVWSLTKAPDRLIDMTLSFEN